MPHIFLPDSVLISAISMTPTNWHRHETSYHCSGKLFALTFPKCKQFALSQRGVLRTAVHCTDTVQDNFVSSCPGKHVCVVRRKTEEGCPVQTSRLQRPSLSGSSPTRDYRPTSDNRKRITNWFSIPWSRWNEEMPSSADGPGPTRETDRPSERTHSD